MDYKIIYINKYHLFCKNDVHCFIKNLHYRLNSHTEQAFDSIVGNTVVPYRSLKK